jgi:hypothetical protein
MKNHGIGTIFVDEADYIAYRERWRPDLAGTPEELVPWPYRLEDAPAPSFCPKCGRRLLHYWWGSVDYHEVACAGLLQSLLRWKPGLLFFIHHWNVTVGYHDRPRRKQRFDHHTGEPMDGHS